MLYSDFQGALKISKLGFGTMRLPLLENGQIDQESFNRLAAQAIEGGVNYFDTALPYHGGKSELAVREALKPYPRESYFLADKFPGHQIRSSYDPAQVFEEQLFKCGTEYFDFYLLHNVYEESVKVYEDPKWGIIDYFLEQKKNGRIKHLGFSSHGRIDFLREFLNRHGKDMEFCQIQLNYLDWTLQDAKAKYELLTERGIPVWVMEPVRGGRLAKLSEAEEAKLKALRPDESIASWGMRWLQSLPNVKLVLSGMNSEEMLLDNINTFSGGKPLSDDETKLLLDIAEGMKDSVPCTGCRYCCEGCPMGLDIPMLIAMYNDLRFSSAGGLTAMMQVECLPEDKKPTACIGCGQCSAICPQKIDVPAALSDLALQLSKRKSWAETCKEREIAEKAVSASLKR